MEISRNDPVCLASIVKERFSNSLSAEDQLVWQHLEQYWADQNKKSQYSDIGMKLKCNNSPSNPTYGGPPRKKSAPASFPISNKCEVVSGAYINDIPSSYNIIGFKSYELIVIGTYVDKNIIPGFQYKVRQNFSEDYFFDGKALVLENIGLGYGKRLTFESESLNKNKNYFWSDSHPHGYGLTFQAITPDVVFRIIDIQTNRDIGRLTVNDPAKSVDIEVSTIAQNNGQVHKTVTVHFTADIVFYNSCNKQSIFYEDCNIHGTAILQRNDLHSKGKIKEIVPQNFITENCRFVPEE